MSDISCLSFSGRLTKDAELKAVGTGLLEFNVAVNIGWGDKASVMFIKCTVWGKRATENLKQYLTKGTTVFVVGSLSIENWTDQAGQTRKELAVNVGQLTFISKPDAPPVTEDYTF